MSRKKSRIRADPCARPEGHVVLRGPFCMWYEKPGTVRVRTLVSQWSIVCSVKYRSNELLQRFDEYIQAFGALDVNKSGNKLVQALSARARART